MVRMHGEGRREGHWWATHGKKRWPCNAGWSAVLELHADVGDGPSWFARQNMQSMEKRNESTGLAWGDSSDVSLCARNQGMQREKKRRLRPLGLVIGSWEKTA